MRDAKIQNFHGWFDLFIFYCFGYKVLNLLITVRFDDVGLREGIHMLCDMSSVMQ